MSDRSLTSQGPAPAGEADALFRSHSAWLRAVLRRRVGPDAAEDLLQETYLRLVGRASSRPVDSPRSLLFRIAANLLIDRHRRVAAQPVLEPIQDEWRLPALAASQVQAIELKQIILGMPQPLREVFLLVRFTGMTHQSVANHLNISVKTVEWRMSKALAYCAERLRD